MEQVRAFATMNPVIPRPCGGGQRSSRNKPGLRFHWSYLACLACVALVVVSSMWLQAGILVPSVAPVQGRGSAPRPYTSALATLSCFATPGCFPSSRCEGGDPSMISRPNRPAEAQPFCIDDLKARGRDGGGGGGGGSGSSGSPCLVYSFGIHLSWEWEESVARLFGCEVHAFDPTVDHKKDLAPGLTFHKLGLQAVGTDVSRTHGAEYGAIDPGLVLPLNEIMERLGHANRTIDVLMMDCEGCEWGALRQLACGPAREHRSVRQIVTEFHYQKSLGLETEEDVLLAAEGLRCLWEERWHVTSIQGSISSPENWEYAPGVPSILHVEGMLSYVSMRRIPPGTPTPAEYVSELADTARARRFPPFAGLGGRAEAWPKGAREAWGELDRREAAARAGWNKFSYNRRRFDTWGQHQE